VSELIQRLTELIDAPRRDADVVDRALADGYARARSLEADQQRLERELAETRAELVELRGCLLQLRARPNRI